jgi:hypothetical protein
MKFTLPVLTKLSESAQIGIVFAAIFITALGIFSLSASVIVSSAFLAVSALAAYTAARQRNAIKLPATEEQREQIERLASRLARVEGAMQSVDTRISSSAIAVRNQIRDEMAPILDAISTIADIIETERRVPSPNIVPKPMVAPAPLPVYAQPPINPLHQLRTESILKSALLSGKLTINTSDIVALPTSRPAYRLLQVEIDGYATSKTEAQLRADGLPAHLIRLFDKVRLAHGFEIAAQLALAADSPLLVCPLTIETLDDPAAGGEIAMLLSRRGAIARHMCFLVSEDALHVTSGTAIQTLRSITDAGCGFAVTIENDIRVDPSSLHQRGVILAMAAAELILATRDGQAPTEIHPADLVDLFDRYGIDLAVASPASSAVLRSIRALGINLVMRSEEDRNHRQEVRMRPERRSPQSFAPAAREGARSSIGPFESDEPAPLRAHLRRVSA